MRKINGKSGFSLIELAMVIVIIGLLVIGVTKGSNMIDDARLSPARALTLASPVASISNLVLWLETTSFDSISANQRFDGASNITTWYDINPQVTTKNNATTYSGSPTYIANGINGLPVIRFSGASAQYLNFNGTALANSNYTIFIIEQRRDTHGSDANNNYFMGSSPTPVGYGNNQLPHLGYRFNTTFTFAQFGNDYDVAVSGYTTPTPIIHTFRFSSTQGKDYWKNGSNLIHQTSGGALQGLINYDNASIGAAFGTILYNGDIAEVIIFNKALTSEERVSVESYLSKKWKIAI